MNRDDPQLSLDIETIAASGLFDETYYAAQTPTLLDDEDLLTHFCRAGWRQLLRPNADFDVWWYWSNYLDPSQDQTNPLVHYALEGRAVGYTGKPATTRASPGHRLPADQPVRRVCLLAGHDVDGVVDDYVVAYARELSRHSDVYYLCDGYVDPAELAKLEECTAGAWAMRHGAYDFGSYSLLAQELVGWDVLDQYDEVLLVNDSCYLLRPLDEVFKAMNARECDWWGLQATKGIAKTAAASREAFSEPVPIARVKSEMLETFEHDVLYDFLVGSYFLAYRRPVVADAGFRRLLNGVHRQGGKLAIIQKYEIGFTRYLIGNGFDFDTFIDNLYPFHPIFSEWYFRLVEDGFPLLKRYFLYQNHYDVPGLKRWKERVQALVPQAPVDTFERNLQRVAPHDRLMRSFAIERDERGVVRVPQVLEGRDFRRRDAATPTFEHWWAFPVSADQHTLPPNSRAIFEEIRDDPSIKKIVLTRSRDVSLTGENVVVLPLTSPEGQEHLCRAGQVFVQDRPHASLGRSLSTDHNVIVVGEGVALERTAPTTSWEPLPQLAPRRRIRAALGSSRVGQLAAGVLSPELDYEDLWLTGQPSLDFLQTSRDRLPRDMRLEEERLREQLDGRRLLLYAPSHRSADHRLADPFTEHEIAHLSTWCADRGVVLGVREDVRDQSRRTTTLLHEVSLDLSVRRYTHVHVLLRSVDVLVTDWHHLMTDFLVTGRPLVSFAPDLDEVADSLVYDLDHVLPSPVARTFEQFGQALESAFGDPDEETQRRYERSRSLFHKWTDDRSGHRTVKMVKSLYVEGVV